MKKISAICFLLLLAMTSCNQTEEEKAGKVAEKYLTAMGNYEFDKAAEYCTDETRVNTIKVIQLDIMPRTDKSYIESNKPATISINSVELTSDTTAVAEYHKSTPIQEQDGKLNLVKRGKNWQAHVLIKLPKEMQQQIQLKYDEDSIRNLHLQVLDK